MAAEAPALDGAVADRASLVSGVLDVPGSDGIHGQGSIVAEVSERLGNEEASREDESDSRDAEDRE
jgi:hypothetical protein